MDLPQQQFNVTLPTVVDLRKFIDTTALPTRLAAVGSISKHLTAVYLTFGQVAADSVTKRSTLPRGTSYEDAV